MDDATGLAEALLGLDGFAVLAVEETPAEVIVTVETTADFVGCPSCGVRAEAKDRVRAEIRDLPCFGRAARLIWLKRRWRCSRPRLCGQDVDRGHRARRPTGRADPPRRSRSHPPGRRARPPGRGRRPRARSQLVDRHGRRGPARHATGRGPGRVKKVRALGIDETSFLSATREHRTIYVTGLVDLDRKRIIDMVEGNAAPDLRRWCADQDPAWMRAVRVVATDLAESYRSGTSPHLDHAIRVADPFHVVRIANRCVDKVRRRVQNETLGHRGRKADPLYRIRKLLLAGYERLDERGHERVLLGLRHGDPHDELLGAWLAKESVRDIYLTEDPKVARVLLDKAIVGCKSDEVEEIRSLGDTLERWRTEILNHHRTGASNGPTEGLNLCVKKVKRAGRGFTCFEHYRLRVLLHAGGVTWPRRPSPPRIRTRSPHSNA